MSKIVGKLKLGENLEKIISELSSNESAYTYPDSIAFDYSFNAYLDLNAPALPHPHPEEGAVVYVEKLDSMKQSYFVDISDVQNYKWERELFPFGEDTEEINNPSYEHSIIKLGKIEHNKPEKKKSIEERIQQALDEENYELVAKLKKQKKD